MSIIAGITAAVGMGVVVFAGAVVMRSVMKSKSGGDGDAPLSQPEKKADDKQKSSDEQQVLKKQADEVVVQQTAAIEKARADEEKKKQADDKKRTDEKERVEKEKRDRELKLAREAEEKKKQDADKKRVDEKRLADEKKRADDERLKKVKNPLNDLLNVEKTASVKAFAPAAVAVKTAVLGDIRPDTRNLRLMAKDLTMDIAGLIGKGLNPAQIAHNLATQGRAPAPDELVPLIDAVSLLLKQQNNKKAITRGMDTSLEITAALNALAKGEPQAVLSILEQSANQKMTDIKLSKTPHEKLDAMRTVADLFRAKAAFERPFDFDKSVDSLGKSKQYDPANVLTDALMARAAYETGKTKQAKELFAELLQSNKGNDFSVAYARQMLPKIAVERAFSHAQEIRKDYDDRLFVTEGYQKTSQTMALRRAALRSHEDENEMVRKQ